MAIVYHPLSERLEEIRVLDLEPATRLDAPLYGRLRHVRLREPSTSFAALSYVWGQMTKDRSEITINYPRPGDKESGGCCGLCFKSTSPRYTHGIGSSLTAALRHLRQGAASTGRRVTIWTDALCINQNDDDEKSWQVPLMKSIYIAAFEVHAWLGPKYDEDPGVSRHMNTTFDLAEKVWNLTRVIDQPKRLLDEQNWREACTTVANPSAELGGRWTEFSQKLRLATLSDPSLRQMLSSVKALAGNEYWARMWILQETGRGRKLTFHYGLRRSSHHGILLTLALVNSVRLSDIDIQLKRNLDGFDTRFLGCLTARTTCARNLTFHEVLAAAYLSPPPLHQATNKRDLIYARLGLAENAKALHVDYKLSVADVFADATRFLLSGGFLDTLTTLKPFKFQRWSSDGDLPSWAYDWTQKLPDTFNRYDASRGTSPAVSFTRNVLNMKGVHVGQVLLTEARCSAIATNSEIGKGAIIDAKLEAMSGALSAEKEEMLSQKILIAYEELGVSVSPTDLNPILSHRSLPFASFWCWWVGWIAALVRLLEHESSRTDNNASELLFREIPEARDDIGYRRPFRTRADLVALTDYRRWSLLMLQGDGEQGSADFSNLLQVAEALFRSAWGLRPALLDNGSLAYVPEDTRPQDEVVILYGVKAPLVVRKLAPSACRILGPSYVLGVMRGELMQGRIVPRAFDLT